MVLAAYVEDACSRPQPALAPIGLTCAQRRDLDISDEALGGSKSAVEIDASSGNPDGIRL